MFFQLPIPQDEVYLEDIEQMVLEEIEDEYAKELDFQHRMDDFIETQEMEETNDIVSALPEYWRLVAKQKKIISDSQAKINRLQRSRMPWHT
jgi:hypothetical protein